MAPTSPQPPSARWSDDGERVTLELAGDWRRDAPAPQIHGDAPRQVPTRFVTEGLGSYDSTLPAFLFACLREGGKPAPGATEEEKKEEEVGGVGGLDGLPPDLRGLMELALAGPEESETQDPADEPSEVRRLGKMSLKVWGSAVAVAEFTGQAMLSLGRLATGRARFRARDFWEVVQQCGPQALPIVMLINFLIGMILAFVGNVQLANFGASLYVADLVGIAMLREMGVVMTGIIMSGRTGAAFAAHLGSMNANQEIDALRTFGFDPFDFLVLPRMIALVLMMPLLTIYANVVGILGGMLVAAMVGIAPALYWNELFAAVTLTTASLGVFKSLFFGAAIAMAGCLQGLRSGGSSAAVGQATTRAVVASITAIIILDCAFAVVFTILDI